MSWNGDRDHHLAYERLKAAYDRDLIAFYVNPKTLLAPDSPVFDPWRAGGPLLGLLLLALLVMVLAGLIAGTIALVVVVVCYLVGIRPWLKGVFRERAIDLALTNEKGLQKLWDYGAFGIALSERPRTLVAGPKGSWKAFMARHLPDIETQVLDKEMTRAFKDSDMPDRRKPLGSIEFKPAEPAGDTDPRGPLTGEIFDGPLPDWDLPSRNEERFR